ncbi:hypothetical protein D9V80_00405 [Buchnera aphidicola (Thelaxes californica)]|uniref:3-oxoacyl-[acyl-carrier-protein] synthase 1 n=1 Tax=Buchnera aphidicola (Thelaxes californica) TaxID=1315998 RepID=A0A4D6YL13_9GAMM|nr:beta-ketoacyl synthase N-terminal-like domain-containing protein [Buchnera aphidicola]QCI26630.1 hypothetical protein D9V80_00405 [Buchnera aphidicola (Thelaxes californica)]
MKRVVITGFGIVSSIGNTEQDIVQSLQKGRSGIQFSQKMKQKKMKSQIWGNLNLHNINVLIPNNILKYMNDAIKYTYLSMQQSIIMSCLCPTLYRNNPRVGLIVGSGSIPMKSCMLNINNIPKNKYGKMRMNPYFMINSMPSGISAVLSTIFNIQGISYTMSSACTTSSHCIGHSFELIKQGKQDIIFAGGGEELSWELALAFDSMRILSKKYNCQPSNASRPYDIDRDGFVISGGGGIVILEELNHAISRSANIYAEIIAYSSVSDGFNITTPSDSGAILCMNKVLKDIHCPIDYINTHGTSTQIGDKKEGQAIYEVFKKKKVCQPMLSSTKSITGHALGVSGVHELIYCILMLKYNFLAPNINIKHLDPFFHHLNIIRQTVYKKIYTIMSNNFGFGGTNVVLIIKKYNHTI